MGCKRAPFPANYFLKNLARLKTRKTWKSWKTQKFFSEIFQSEFSILAIGQNRKLGNKKTRNNISEISEISEVSEFSICHFFISFLIFFSVVINVFSGSFFYICNFSSTLDKYSSFISLTK